MYLLTDGFKQLNKGKAIKQLGALICRVLYYMVIIALGR
jgi:hypothetical protein